MRDEPWARLAPGLLGRESLFGEFLPNRIFGVGKDAEISLCFAQFLSRKAGDQMRSDEIPAKCFA